MLMCFFVCIVYKLKLCVIHYLYYILAFDVCAFDNRFMHETYRTMACAWDKNEDAVSATVTLMDNPYDVTEEILDEIPCMLFSFFSVRIYLLQQN